MALRRTIKSWERDEITMMKYYDFDLNHPDSGLPKFGSDVRIDALRDARIEAYQSVMGEVGDAALSRHGKKTQESSTLPTLLNFTWHFHYIDEAALQAVQMIAEQYPEPTKTFTHALLQTGEDKFFHDHVEPLREYLEWKWQIYFYCLPAAAYETQLVGGKGWRTTGPLILTMLPKFPQVLLARGGSEDKLRQVGGLVFWLVRSKLCINCKTQERIQDLREVLGAWKPYVQLYHLIGELEKIERNNPFLITEQVRDTLLPPSARDLLLPPEEGQHE